MNTLNQAIVRLSFTGDHVGDVDCFVSAAFEAAIGTTTLVRPYLARALLGWRPRKPSLIDGLDTYYNSWKATQ